MEKRHESIAAQLAGKRKGYVPRTPSMIIWLRKPIDRFVGFKSKLCGVQCLIVPALIVVIFVQENSSVYLLEEEPHS